LDFLNYWTNLENNAELTDIERFASLVQYIVTVNATNVDTRDDAVDYILDDMVDLFVGGGFQDLKGWLMANTEPVLDSGSANEHISDPAPYTGFSPLLQKGEG